MRSAYIFSLLATVLLGFVLCDHYEGQKVDETKTPSVGSSGGHMMTPHHAASGHSRHRDQGHEAEHSRGKGHIELEEHASQHHHHHHHHHQISEDENMTCHKIAPYLASFAFSLFNLSVSEDKYHNVFFSPVSIATAFAMLSLGARRETLNAIWQGLHFDLTALSMETIHDGFHHLIDMLNDAESELQLTMGNALFIKRDLKFLQSFHDNVKNQYMGEAFLTNFENTVNSKKEINDYVSKRTNGKITDLISSLDQRTLMVLVSYIFFRGNWETPFDKDNTKDDDFHVDNSTAVKVEMMFRSGQYSNTYDKELGCHVVTIPYKGNVTALLILPDEGKLETVENALSRPTVLKWVHSMHRSYIDLYLPKFSISSTLNLKKIFSKMGIAEVFTDQADLSGITGEPNLKVTKAVHKATLTIDEKGTEAAGATAIDIMPITLPPVIKFDRPFLFSIYHKSVRATLFMGRIMNPNEQ